MDDRLKRAQELEAEAQRLRVDYNKTPPLVVRTPYLIKDKPGEFLVGVKDEPQVGDYPYNGPCARVYGDATWVNIVTNDYEGHAMLNREALPLLIEALQLLDLHLSGKP